MTDCCLFAGVRNLGLYASRLAILLTHTKNKKKLRHFLSVLRTSSSSVPPGMWIPIPAYPVHNHTDSVQVRIDTHTNCEQKRSFRPDA